MASGAKKKTTMAKLMRETRLRERRFDKQAKKDARKLAPAETAAWDAEPAPLADESAEAVTAAAVTGEPAPVDA
jgi:hypothetical protein